MKARVTLTHTEEFEITPHSLDLPDNTSNLTLLAELTKLYLDDPGLVYELACESDKVGSIKVEEVLDDGNTRFVTDG